MKKTLILSIFVLFFFELNAQIKIKELPPYDLTRIDSSFIGLSSKRSIIPLRAGWQIYSPDSPENVTKVTIPCAFEGTENLIYEREISFSNDLIIRNQLELVFLGLNYSGEILINNKLIYKHPGGEIPFTVELPKDILNYGKPNKLKIILHYKPDAQTTIPFKNGFLFPKNLGGITRDVFIRLTPNTSIKKIDIVKKDFQLLPKADLVFNCQFEKNIPAKKVTAEEENYYISAAVLDNGNITASIKNFEFVFDKSNRAKTEFQISLTNAKSWSPSSPNVYQIKVQLYKNSELIDEVIKTFTLYELSTSSENFTLNGQPFVLNGTTYLGSFNGNGNLVSYEELEKDLSQIKEAGFNSVRFAKIIPHPYSVYLCEKLGLFAFIELPANSIPESFVEESNFVTRAENYLRVYLNEYSKYSSVAGVGLGSSYIADSPQHIGCIDKLSNFVKSNFGYFTYASFIGYPQRTIENLDFYGIEIYSKPVESVGEKITGSINSLGKNKIFFSEITYPYYNGSKNGYDTPNSIEAQAKYINDFINLSRTQGLSGYFINSLFDYTGEYSSFYAGYSGSNVYKVGILGKDKNENNLAYKVLKYNLSDGDKVTIPIGIKENDSPLYFILIALALAVVMGIIMNSKRKFREDASRALMRPYNFYADIRDHRVLSGFHTFVLMFILAGSHALLQIILLYYLRTNILLEKVVLSAGSSSITSLINYLAWNPLQAFVYLFVFTIILFVVISVIVKTASLFIKTKVMFSSIYFVVIWAFLPFALMLPVELILYKILQNGSFNYYIYGFCVLFSLWIVQRLLKGVFVIFDVPAYKVYFYTFLLAVVVIGGKILYFQLSESTIDYIVTSIKQFQLM